MRWIAMRVALGLLPALAGCTLSDGCRTAGMAGSAANQACIGTILQQENALQDQRDQAELRGKEKGFP